MSDAERQPDAIERDIEEARERLATTIDQLVYRANPKTIIRREIATVRAYFVDQRGNPRTENILKVAGGVAGFVTLVVVIRRVTR
ncbi:MAG: hypothetical protein AVDCRST_MAG34-374 [uncultured Nocardioidaceae bacterium]|uniref:DUF3618 domain-containing protein n=1 Tax=uncultured Nocardioidaceae bacterium TaxID=253824 RepID=A0A6J4LIQ9_9ACTN|nr:MAG: hypothetical protein AVDCRST_MAG34-374 [uncultured Nocardioidaceae bacterium]